MTARPLTVAVALTLAVEQVVTLTVGVSRGVVTVAAAVAAAWPGLTAAAVVAAWLLLDYDHCRSRSRGLGGAAGGAGGVAAP